MNDFQDGAALVTGIGWVAFAFTLIILGKTSLSSLT